MKKNQKERETEYREKLNRLNSIAIMPTGNSMWPTLKNKKQSVIVKKPTGRLSKNDVALYVSLDGNLILHRVREITADGYIMQGDSQTRTEAIKNEQIVGVMDGFYLGKKYISVTDESYKKRVEKWYENEKKRKKRIKMFYIRQAIKGKLIKIFKGGQNGKV